MGTEFVTSLLQACAKDIGGLQLQDEAAIRHYAGEELPRLTRIAAAQPAEALEHLKETTAELNRPGSHGMIFPTSAIARFDADGEIVYSTETKGFGPFSKRVVGHTALKMLEADGALPPGLSAVDLPIAVKQYVARLQEDPTLDPRPLEMAAGLDKDCFRETTVPDRRAFIANLGARYREDNLPTPGIDSPLSQALMNLREQPILQMKMLSASQQLRMN